MFVIKMYRTVLAQLLAQLERTAKARYQSRDLAYRAAHTLCTQAEQYQADAEELNKQAAALRPLLGK